MTKFNMMYLLLYFEVFIQRGTAILYIKYFGTPRLLAWKHYFEVYLRSITWAGGSVFVLTHSIVDFISTICTGLITVLDRWGRHLPIYDQALRFVGYDKEDNKLYRNHLSLERIMNTDHFCFRKLITKPVHIR